MNLSSLNPNTQKRVDALVARFNDKKSWLISEIVAEYKLDSALTPEHLLKGLKGAQNVGTAYGAWYVHKSGVEASAISTIFVANNYNKIVVKDNPADMLGELARVSALVTADKRAEADRNASTGVALAEGLTSISESIAKVSKLPLVPSQASDGLIMALEVAIASLRANYTKVAESLSKDTINA